MLKAKPDESCIPSAAAAHEKAGPHRREAERFRAEAGRLGGLIAAEASGRKRDRERIAVLREKRKAAEREAKKHEARTPEQLRGIISTQHREVGKLPGDLAKAGK